MISVGSLLYISDNSGGLTASCIKVPGNNPRMKGKVGDIVVVTLKKVRTHKKLKSHQLKKALLIGTVYPVQKSNGVVISSAKNNIILLDDKYAPISNRINQYVFSGLRIKNYMKIVSISLGLI